MKITDTICKDGKKHKWIYPSLYYISKMDFRRYGIKWCEKCGSLTEVVCNPLWKKTERRTKIGKKWEIIIPKERK